MKATFKDVFCEMQYLQQLFATVVVMSGVQLTSVSVILYYSDYIFIQVGLSWSEAPNFTLGKKEKLFKIHLYFACLNFELLTENRFSKSQMLFR